MSTQKKTRLDDLIAKHGKPTKQKRQAGVASRFGAATDDETYQRDFKNIESAGSIPLAGGDISTGDLHVEMARIQRNIAKLARQHSDLGVSFNELIGSEAKYSFGESVELLIYGLVGADRRKERVMDNAVRRRGDSLTDLTDKIALVLTEQYESAKQGKSRASDLKVQIVTHMEYLDRQLIKHIKGGNYTNADQKSLEIEVKKLDQELEEVNAALTEYEVKMGEAKANDDIDNIQLYAEDMETILDIKYSLMEKRLSAEGAATSIRQEMVESAEGVQSAKGAYAASRVNLAAATALEDAMHELVVKHQFALEHVVEVYKQSSQIAAMGMDAIGKKDLLLEASRQYQDLMDLQARIVTHLAAETFEMLKTPTYDLERARQTEEMIHGYMSELNASKVKWAKTMQTAGLKDNAFRSKHYQPVE